MARRRSRRRMTDENVGSRNPASTTRMMKVRGSGSGWRSALARDHSWDRSSAMRWMISWAVGRASLRLMERMLDLISSRVINLRLLYVESSGGGGWAEGNVARGNPPQSPFCERGRFCQSPSVPYCGRGRLLSVGLDPPFAKGGDCCQSALILYCERGRLLCAPFSGADGDTWGGAGILGRPPCLREERLEFFYSVAKCDILGQYPPLMDGVLVGG